MIKRIGKNILCSLLEAQVKRLRAQHQFKVVAVAGSVGKTSTKLAIARTLSHRTKVIFQDGNYNDRLTVPLVLFGHTEPPIFNIAAWFKILLANRRIINSDYDYGLAVLELGTDAPGQLEAFRYLQPDLTVITAIAAEHMEYFESLERVAAEELTPVQFSKQTLLNLDDIAAKFLPNAPYIGYGAASAATYRFVQQTAHGLAGQSLEIALGSDETIQVATLLPGRSIAKALLASAAVAHLLDWSGQDIIAGLEAVGPVAGRMQILPGQHGATLIDDTYNASPIAVRTALDSLYDVAAPQRIAILGSMNELGASSQAEHAVIGAYCDPKKLDVVVTIGQTAKEYLAPAAEKAGCTVVAFDTPYEAGNYVKHKLVTGAVVLAKGSQNGVFAEEAVKLLLANPGDAARLVRQSANWQRIKQQQFPITTPRAPEHH